MKLIITTDTLELKGGISAVFTPILFNTSLVSFSYFKFLNLLNKG